MHTEDGCLGQVSSILVCERGTPISTCRHMLHPRRDEKQGEVQSITFGCTSFQFGGGISSSSPTININNKKRQTNIEETN